MKPAYKIPTMAEVARVKKNGFRVASTFSGTGGSSLGYRMAGFDVVWANEFVPAAADSYAANFPSTKLDRRDIRQVEPEEVLAAAGLKPGELDLFDGSPPCASFSTAGKREAGWGKVKKYSDTEQRTDDLFFQYVRLLRGIRPKVFVAENVSGLVKGTAKGYFLEILRELSVGYVVKCKVLDAQWLGVPQARQRTIFVGVRSDLAEKFGVGPSFPTPLPHRFTIADALPGLRGKERAESEAWMTGHATGKEWHRVPVGGQSAKYFQLVKPSPSQPCPTLTASAGNAGLASVCHPFFNRKFSVAESKRLCSFPEDFKLTGDYSQKIERLGRSVPPLMMRAVAEAVRDGVLARLPKKPLQN